MLYSILVCGGILAVIYIILNFTLLKLPKCKSTKLLHGKTVIITGANTGIGKTTAVDLAKRGARVILACRDQQRAEAAARDIREESGNKEVVYMHLDLASLESVRSFAAALLQNEPRLDILINNAGLMVGGRTKDGIGMILGVNHLGHFLLTLLLLERLKECSPSRVVNVSSLLHRVGRIDFGCLTAHKDLALGNSETSLYYRYSHSKLCNVLFTRQLAKRLQGTGVTCYSLHPGAIKTEIGRYTSLLWRMVTMPFIALLFADPVSGAQTTLHCALQDGIEHLSGAYFSRCAAEEPAKRAKDDAVAEKLWEVSERLCGLA